MKARPIAQPLLTLDRSLPKLTDIRDNFSAIVVADDHLWLGGDEGTSIDRLTVDAGGDFGEHARFDLATLLPGMAPGSGGEIDIEGLDADGGYLWLIGSHSSKRKKAEKDKSPSKNRERLAEVAPEELRHTLARVPLVNGQLKSSAGSKTAAVLQPASDGRGGNELSDRLRADQHLGRFSEIPSKDNGIDVEGLAVSGSRVFAGLRGPVLRGWAVVLELELDDASPGELGLVGELKKHFVQLDGLGVRELAIRGRDLYILAGPTMDLDGPVAIYKWPAALDASKEAVVWRSELEHVLAVPYGKGDDAGRDHAEGVSFMGASGLNLLVCYDSPAKHRLIEGRPECVRLDTFDLESSTDD